MGRYGWPGPHQRDVSAPGGLTFDVRPPLRPPLGIAVLAAVLLFRFSWSGLQTFGVCAAVGLVAGLSGLPVG